MTNDEAIDILNNLISIVEYDQNNVCYQALKIAIETLKKEQEK